MTAYVPASTYRLQLNAAYPFDAARLAVPYLDALGVTDVYLSPVFRARPGSPHGYDICSQRELNPELGSEADWHALVEALRGRGMGIVLDVVANHMGTDPSTNPWWRDVLENGRGSQFATYFDIDWEPVKTELAGKVLVPLLGDRYGVALEEGSLRVAAEDGRFVLAYGDRRLPLSPLAYPWLLRCGLDSVEAGGGDDDPDLRELLSVITAFSHLPPPDETSGERIAERRRESAVASERLARLVERSPAIAAHVEAAVAWINGTPGVPASFDALHELLERQPYRLAYWRTAADEINYRRFFDVNDLAGVRVEVPEVFDATHELVRALLARGDVRGLRIDHPDGLFDPGHYFARLQRLAREATGGTGSADGQDSTGGSGRAVYLVAEKILGPAEHLDPSWLVHGTTGYDWMNVAGGVFVDAAGEHGFRRLYQRFAGRAPHFAEVAYEAKSLIMRTALASELNVLAHRLNDLTEDNRRSRDFTLNSLRAMIREYVACLPIYRTYLTPDGIRDEERAVVRAALHRAAAKRRDSDPIVFRFLAQVLLPPVDGGDGEFAPASPAEQASRVQFAMQLQQYTGPVQAKGVEDTAFYRDNVLLSLNEVGGDPSRFGHSIDAFHQHNAQRRRAWPDSLTSTATHDTKLGEDVRARLNALTEWPDEWRRAVFTWSRINARWRTLVDGEWAPARNDEYRFYQALLGAWPMEVDPADGAPRPLVERLSAYMLKSAKEAKLRTSWINEHHAYDAALRAFVEQSLGGATKGRFLSAFAPLWRQVALAGVIDSLGQLVLKLASPGVPDVYQGCESWDLNLVDPDNRRPVDYAARTAMLAELEPALWDAGRTASNGDRVEAVREALSDWRSPRVKMLVTASGLRCRRARAATLRHGTYAPLPVVGRRHAHVVAFAREHEGDAVVAAVTRLPRGLNTSSLAPPRDAWEDTIVRFPETTAGTWLNVMTGERLDAGQPAMPASRVFATLPAALFVPVE